MGDKAIKIAISGKGGVGKTTVAALLCRYLEKTGKRVIAVDADPVASLGSALGIPDHHDIQPIAQMQDLIFERTGAKPGTMGGFFKMNPRVDDIPDRFSKRAGNILLMVMGTVDHGGSGCVCPESILLKNLIQHLLLYRDDALVLDMEAGVEHLGRATAKAVNLMLTVVEPGARSIHAAKMVKALSADIGLHQVVAVANKIRSEDDEKAIVKALGDLPLLGGLPYDPRLVEADLAGEAAFKDQKSIPDQFSKVMQAIIDRATGQ